MKRELARKWFEEVKKISLTRARAENLDPLEGTGLFWYQAKYPRSCEFVPALEFRPNSTEFSVA